MRAHLLFCGEPCVATVTDCYWRILFTQFNVTAIQCDIHQNNPPSKKAVTSYFLFILTKINKINEKLLKTETTPRAVSVEQFYYHKLISVTWNCFPLSDLSLDILKWRDNAGKGEGQLPVLEKSSTCWLMLS